MEIKVFESKNKEELIVGLQKILKCEEKDMLYKIETKKGGLFKSDSYLISGITLNEIKKEIITFLEELLKNMKLDVKFESNIREQQINIKMFSNNNAILIGKNGQTLIALQNIVKQMIFSNIGLYPYVILDVENYKDKKQSNLEYLAKKLAREVIKTKHEVILDDMNSYERKIVHNVLTDFSNISTESEGEEPHRHIIIKYKEEK